VTFSFALHYYFLPSRFVYNHGSDTYAGQHNISTCNSNQTKLTPSAITTNLVKVQPSSTLRMNVFHFNTTESKDPLAQTNIAMNVEEEGEQKNLL
jgi:hypothetical protein